MKKIYYIFLTLVVILLIPVMTIIAEGNQTTIIKIGINEGKDIKDSVTYKITDALNYSWVVDETEYIFENDLINIDDVYTHYDVIIIDGTTDEVAYCIRDLQILFKSDDFRKKLEDAIKGGVGYIGRCGGSWLPPQYDEPQPDGMIEYYGIKRNAFLEDIKMHAKVDFQVFSQFLNMKYWTFFFNRPGFRSKWDAGALGLLAYSEYGSNNPEAINKTKNINGYFVDLEKLNYEHPILKDYYGGTLYTKSMGGGGFPVEDLPDYVDALAYFPADCTDKNPKQDITVWEVRPRNIKEAGCLKLWIKFIKDNPFPFPGIFDDEDREWAVDSITSVTQNVTWWYKQPDENKVKTETQELPAIIAFEYPGYDHGRVVLCGPHIASDVLTDKNAEIIDTQGDGINISEGLYHWWSYSKNSWVEYDNGEEKGDVVPNEDLYWYQRREAAWASGSDLVPDDNLPPVYGRSQVVDINPLYKDSTEFTIKCCVGKNNEETWNWTDVDLTLYYRFTPFSPDEPTDWTIFGVKHDRPYSFIFNSPNGPGIYEFCSNLTTEDLKGNVVYEYLGEDPPPGPDTIAPPPEPDAIVYVQAPILAVMGVNGIHKLAGDPISFNSNNSFTAAGSSIINYTWDFGDGNFSFNQSTEHNYSKKGVYNVTLNITNNRSNSDAIYKVIEIYNNPPYVNFTMDKQIIFTGETINFTNNSFDVDGEIVSQVWDFGDETNSTQQNTSHSFAQSGFYTVSLEATDDDNDIDNMNSCILVVDSLVNKSQTPADHIWNNITDALDNASYGEYIFVENGSYYENITINKSINLLGENKNNVIVQGNFSINNPHDFELPTGKGVDLSIIVNMTGNILLMRFNNETTMGENYSNSSLVFDYSGENNNGTNNGAAWTTSTIKGSGAFMFDGVDDSINISCLPNLADSCITVSGWVYWNNDTSVIDPIISQKTGSNGYLLYMNGSTGKPVFCLNNIETESNVGIGFNEWHYIAGTYDGENLRIYVDGYLTGSNDTTASGVNTSCYIGYDNLSNFYSGIIDEICVWNRTLPADEISLIYNGNKHIVVQSITFQDSDIGLRVCNHSEIVYCDFNNSTIGLLLDNSSDTEISMCNITNCTTGIKIIDSAPEDFYYNNIVDCYIDDTDFGIVVENSTYINLIRNLVNGTSCNMSFNEGSDFGNISTIDCDSPGNVAPFTPDLSGPTLGEINKPYTYYACTNDSNDDQILYRFDWDDGNVSDWMYLFDSNETVNTSHTWSEQGGYMVKVMAKDVFDNESEWSTPVLFRTETIPPIINSFGNDPVIVGFGEDVTINANVTDDETGNYSGVKTVHVNITFPDSSNSSYTMSSVGGTDFEYVFSDTWLVGQYNYTICACDKAYNWNNSSSVGCFNVSVQANMSVCTINDTYSDNRYLNLTDPPGLDPESQGFISYELLDNNSVLHIWNRFDNYYFNTSNGVQLTNNYNQYWSHNVLMLGYYNNDQWNLIYRTDELSGFNKDIVSDNETFVNITIWKDLSYGGFDFRLALRYYLGINDSELTVIPYIKNLGVTIPYVLGFAWEIKDIRVDMTPENDYIEINGSSYFLNQSLDETYNGLGESCFYINEDFAGNRSESLYLRWDGNLSYRVCVKSRNGQYNAPVTLGIKIGTLDVGQEKCTFLFWHDASSVVFYFNSYDSDFFGESWLTNPGYMVDGNESTFASTSVNHDVELLKGNTCNKSSYGTIAKVELRCKGYRSGSGFPNKNIILRPVFSGGDGNNHSFVTGTTASWSSWFNITGDSNAPGAWSWTNVDLLDCDVESDLSSGYTLYCSRVEVRVTYNDAPVISNPYPSYGETGVGLCPLLNITVSDNNGDYMNITWYYWNVTNWVVFGTHHNVGNGTYSQQFDYANVNGQWWDWKVCVDDGVANVSSAALMFYTGNKSEIANTGSTNMSGYLLMQIEFYDSGVWILDNTVVNESSVRTVAVGGELGLDTFFNGLVSIDDLSNGNGLYCVYAALRDPESNVLVCDDDSLLEASYEFTVET